MVGGTIWGGNEKKRRSRGESLSLASRSLGDSTQVLSPRPLSLKSEMQHPGEESRDHRKRPGDPRASSVTNVLREVTGSGGRTTSATPRTCASVREEGMREGACVSEPGVASLVARTHVSHAIGAGKRVTRSRPRHTCHFPFYMRPYTYACVRVCACGVSRRDSFDSYIDTYIGGGL